MNTEYFTAFQLVPTIEHFDVLFLEIVGRWVDLSVFVDLFKVYSPWNALSRSFLNRMEPKCWKPSLKLMNKKSFQSKLTTLESFLDPNICSAFIFKINSHRWCYVDSFRFYCAGYLDFELWIYNRISFIYFSQSKSDLEIVVRLTLLRYYWPRLTIIIGEKGAHNLSYTGRLKVVPVVVNLWRRRNTNGWDK